MWPWSWSVIINIHDHHCHHSLANKKQKIRCYSKPGHLIFLFRPIRCKGGVNTPYRTVIAFTGTELVRTWERERQTSDVECWHSNPGIVFSKALLQHWIIRHDNTLYTCSKLFTSLIVLLVTDDGLGDTHYHWVVKSH